MIPKSSKIRMARPTDNLDLVSQMYIKGLGFEILARFENHQEFDGIVLGHDDWPYHLEFTHHRGSVAGKCPTRDNLLVFYIPDKKTWNETNDSIIAAGFKMVSSFNPYWDRFGRTYEDCDGYRVVLQNTQWGH